MGIGLSHRPSQQNIFPTQDFPCWHPQRKASVVVFRNPAVFSETKDNFAEEKTMAVLLGLASSKTTTVGECRWLRGIEEVLVMEDVGWEKIEDKEALAMALSMLLMHLGNQKVFRKDKRRVMSVEIDDPHGGLSLYEKLVEIDLLEAKKLTDSLDYTCSTSSTT
ncbi:hypothetical protein Fmac_009126 [Flemingia macrophylla]|uniref:Uncharacterized protein n=1 Tax=Flemingia macrophylla TaxID=520843 RepID=A0ABD1MZC2_9FABA